MRQMDNGETAIYDVKYLGKTMCGFVQGQEYACKISKDIYGYFVEEIDEYVENPAAMRYASAKSIERYWDFEIN